MNPQIKDDRTLRRITVANDDELSERDAKIALMEYLGAEKKILPGNWVVTDFERVNYNEIIAWLEFDVSDPDRSVE